MKLPFQRVQARPGDENAVAAVTVVGILQIGFLNADPIVGNLIVLRFGFDYFDAFRAVGEKVIRRGTAVAADADEI